MNVAYIFRHPGPGRFSLERMWATFSEALPSGIEWSMFECPRINAAPADLYVNMKAVRRLRADVYHIVGDVQYAALSLPADRTVLTVADCNLVHRAAGLKKVIFAKLWYEWPIRRCRAVTTISDFTARDVAALVPRASGKIRTVYVPLSRGFSFSERAFHAERPVVLQMGALWNKNLERVAEALSGIPCRLRIVGRLSERQKETLIRHRIEAEIISDIPDAQMPRVYAESDLVVFASLYEGFGMPIIEAQATGRPVISGNVCSMPEVAGPGACLVNPLDVQAIRQAILRVIQDGAYRDRLVSSGLENVRRFSPERIAGQYAALYREIVGRPEEKPTKTGG
jgi:glycosyltransferase involved in cell wall biosynthesis